MTLRILDSLLLLLICLRPLIIYPLFRDLDYLLNILFVLLTFLYLSFSRTLKRVAYEPLFLIFTVSILASFVNFGQPDKRLPVLSIYLFYVALLYFSYFEKGKKYYLVILLIGAIPVCLYALRTYFLLADYTLAYMSSHNLSYAFAQEFILRKRAFAPFILPSLLGGYLAMILPLSCGVVAEKLKNKEKDFIASIAFISFLLAAVGLFLTRSIGAWSALILAVGIYFLITRKISKKALIIIGALGLVFGLLLVLRQRGADFTTAGFSLGKRLDYWQRTIGIIAAHPVKGIGIGNFSLPESRFAHNSYLQIWAEAGVFAFASYLCIVFFFIKRGFTLIKENDDFRLAGLFVSGLVFIIHNLADFTFFIPQVGFLWWIILGCILGYPQPTGKKLAAPPNT